MASKGWWASSWGGLRWFNASLLGTAVIVLVPVLIVLGAWLLPKDTDVWVHLQEELLLRYCLQTLGLLIGVVVSTAVVGLGLAWIIATMEFPGRRFLKTGFLLPFAVPAYVMGFVYVGLFEAHMPAWLDFRSYPGVVWVLTVTLYPYMYFLCLSAFSSQGQRLMDVGQSMGLRHRQILFRIAIPFARPWILGAMAMIGMETLADFGTVSVFVYDTLATGIYKAWYGLFSPTTAAQLAGILVLFAGVFLYFTKRGQDQEKFQASDSPPLRRIILKGTTKYIVTGGVWFFFALAFIFPVGQLLIWSLEVIGSESLGSVLSALTNSILIGLLASSIITALAFCISIAHRFSNSRLYFTATLCSGLGYALPGSVLAIGVYLPLIWFDQKIEPLWVAIGFDSGNLFTGGLLALLIGLMIRFLTVGISSIQNQMARHSPRLDEAAANSGAGLRRSLVSLHIPMLRSGFFIGFVLAFADCLKEMPLTLMTRPVGWDTLSVKIFELTSEGEWERAAVPSLALILCGFAVTEIMRRQWR